MKREEVVKILKIRKITGLDFATNQYQFATDYTGCTNLIINANQGLIQLLFLMPLLGQTLGNRK
jgi:hypothetical protein